MVANKQIVIYLMLKILIFTIRYTLSIYFFKVIMFELKFFFMYRVIYMVTLVFLFNLFI